MDYELFFQKSGSIQKCLIEPTDALLEFADRVGLRITFFIDAGMLCRMEQLAPEQPTLEADLARVKSHISSIAGAGHEIGLHIHPHWEDTQFVDAAWDFTSTRYKLDHFGDDEIGDIVERYTRVLNELCDGNVRAYRAGGFCIEPFGRLRSSLLRQGITVDSSVVPGLRIEDPDKGVDFTSAPDKSWWYFDGSPANPEEAGEFVEIPVTRQVLPFSHYWLRALARILGRQPAAVSGDGMSKAIGRKEVIRRLTGRGRVSELSVDAPKASGLNANGIVRSDRRVWHVMGHPKLLGQPSFDALEKFIDRKKIQRFTTVAGIASVVRARTTGRGEK